MNDQDVEIEDAKDRLLTWIFDETVIYQEDMKVIEEIVSNYDKLPLNV